MAVDRASACLDKPRPFYAGSAKLPICLLWENRAEGRYLLDRLYFQSLYKLVIWFKCKKKGWLSSPTSLHKQDQELEVKNSRCELRARALHVQWEPQVSSYTVS